RIPSAAPSHVRVPPELEGLRRLAYNLYWSWHPRARGLFGRINGGVWARTHAPIPVLTSMVDWPALLDNSDFIVEAQRVIAEFDLSRMPLTRALGREGDPLTVSVELPERTVHIDVWTVQVGRVPVLLLDTDNPINDPADRPITHILYVRGREMRLHQELILGVGGVRALRALNIKPDVWHLNEGHSAFLLAERARERVVAGDDLDTALAAVARNSVFTIHTPVSAGNERFDADLVRTIAGPLFGGDGRRRTG